MRRFYRVGLLLTLCLVLGGCERRTYKITHYLPDGTTKIYEGYEYSSGSKSNRIYFTDVKTGGRVTIAGEYAVERIRNDAH